MHNVLVTGGAGFIGSHLVRVLSERGVRVRVLDNFSSGSREKLAGVSCVDIVEGDVRDMDVCRAACQDAEAVFHLAALVSVAATIAEPLLADEINTRGTLNVLTAAREAGVRRVVFSSSAAVYGDTEVIPTPESAPTRPLSPYGVQKLMGEHYCRLFTTLYGLETVCLRYFNVYGPHQNPNSAYAAAVPKFVTRLLSGAAPIVFGDGEQTRDFCYVGDIVAANLCAATVSNPAAFGEAFNIAGGVRTSLNELLAHLRIATGRDLPSDHRPARVGDICHSAADISRARAILGFSSAIPLADGLRATVDAYTES